MNNFIAIDVETANSDMASICQIGLVTVEDLEIQSEWTMLINPQDYFDPINISIHGITEKDVSKSPKFKEIHKDLMHITDSHVLVCHTHFDRISIHKACEKCFSSSLNVKWLDSARVARRTWEQFAYRGYGLSNISRYLNYEYKKHDALEDAKAAANIMVEAIVKTGLTVEDWLNRVEKPIKLDEGRSSKGTTVEGNPEGPLYGEVVVFTGALSISRKEATTLAASIGCTVTGNVSKKTTLLVVGEQDIRRLEGAEKSTKHRKAEELIRKGQSIRVLCEKDFEELVDSYI